MRVTVEIEQEELDGDYRPVDGLRLTCSRCGHEVEVFGTEQRSEDRGLATMRDECPKGEKNFYVANIE